MSATSGVMPPAAVLKEGVGFQDIKIQTAEEYIRSLFTNGHPRYVDIALKQLKLHSDKNHDYAAGGDPLGNFTRVAAIFSQYPNLTLSDPRVVALVYAMKQIDAILWALNSNIEAKVEGIEPRCDDVSVYYTIVQAFTADLAAAAAR